VVAAAALAGCGGNDGGPAQAPRPVSLALDFTPNAVHAPIYAAVRAGRDRARGVRLRIVAPGASPDSLKAVLSGRADLGVLDIHDLGLAAIRGRDVVAVAALVQRPLAAIVAVGGVRRPRDLEGRKVGVSGLPSDPAVLRAVMEHDGGDPSKVRQVTIGFASVANLAGGNVAAVPVFWNAEGVALRERGVRTREFRVDDYGAPRYPEVVLVTRRATLDARGDDVRAAVRAIADGIGVVARDPAAAAREIAAASGSDEPLVAAQLRATQPLFGTALDRRVLEEWAAWDVRFGILPRRPDVARVFDLG
jgi:NitT/TauT family transport system substrate-binding protein/putative hydroxymethylpyrimidine transport system substrate-binding protein